MQRINRWFRLHDNRFIHKNGISMFGYDDNNDITHIQIGISMEMAIKEAHTPYGLVKEKDLIRVKYDCDPSEIEEVKKATGTDFICGDGYHIDFRDVIEILTPSSNGYDSQWEKE